MKFSRNYRIFHPFVKILKSEISLSKNGPKPPFWECEICEISETSLIFTFQKTTTTYLSPDIFFRFLMRFSNPPWYKFCRQGT